jgi:hypothetical protein
MILLRGILAIDGWWAVTVAWVPLASNVASFTKFGTVHKVKLSNDAKLVFKAFEERRRCESRAERRMNRRRSINDLLMQSTAVKDRLRQAMLNRTRSPIRQTALAIMRAPGMEKSSQFKTHRHPYNFGTVLIIFFHY